MTAVRQLSEEERKAIDQIRANTVRYRIKHVIGNTVRNLASVPGKLAATRVRQPLRDRPAVIVAAGPSLDKQVGLLKERADDLAILCVNTAAPVLKSHGLRPDVVVSIEGVDVSGQMDPMGTDHIAVDISAHVNSFAKADMWLASYSPHNGTLCSALNSCPIDYGCSVATTAFSLACEWGANPIMLIGQDLAYTDGRAYAEGTQWEATEVTHENGKLRFSEIPGKVAWQNASGIPRPPPLRDAFPVDGWNGDTVLTTTEMVQQLQWYNRRARGAGYRRFINCTEGGAHIPGFLHIPFREALGHVPQWHGETWYDDWEVVTQAEVDNAYDILRAEGEAAVKLSDHMLHGELDMPWKRLVKGVPFVDGLVMGQVLQLQHDNETDLDPRERLIFIYEAWGAAGRALVQLIDEVRGAPPQKG